MGGGGRDRLGRAKTYTRTWEETRLFFSSFVWDWIRGITGVKEAMAFSITLAIMDTGKIPKRKDKMGGKRIRTELFEYSKTSRHYQ